MQISGGICPFGNGAVVLNINEKLPHMYVQMFCYCVYLQHLTEGKVVLNINDVLCLLPQGNKAVAFTNYTQNCYAFSSSPKTLLSLTLPNHTNTVKSFNFIGRTLSCLTMMDMFMDT